MNKRKQAPKKVSSPKTIITKFDKSPFVYQRDKVNYDLKIREFPWTEKQKALIDLFMDKKCKVLLLKGCAGVSKTLLSVYMGLKLLEQKKVTEMILIRSAVESADNRLGFLKGELSAKFEPYLTPFYEKFDELIDPATMAKLEKEERIHFIPNNFLRGTQFSVKFVFCDEAQNLSVKEHLTLLSRIGEFSKVIIGGDTDQCDIPINKSGFLKVYDSFNNEEAEKHGIYCFEFGPEDNMRSDVSKFVTEKFKEIH